MVSLYEGPLFTRQGSPGTIITAQYTIQYDTSLIKKNCQMLVRLNNTGLKGPYMPLDSLDKYRNSDTWERYHYTQKALLANQLFKGYRFTFGLLHSEYSILYHLSWFWITAELERTQMTFGLRNATPWTGHQSITGNMTNNNAAFSIFQFF